MSQDGYLPPGVEYADIPGMYAEEDPLCDCGHPQTEHVGGYAECSHEEELELCSCQGFEPPGAY